MKKIIKALFLGLLILGSNALVAQNLSTIRGDYHQSSFAFKAADLRFTLQEVDGVTYTNLQLPGSNPSSVVGRPNLPVFSQMVEIPLCSNVKVSVANVQTKTLDALKYRVMPVQPTPSKSDRGPRPFVIDNQFYAQNAFAEGPHAWVEVMGVARDRNIAILHVSPISYNPVTGQLQQITAMDITLTFEGADVAATRELHQRYFSPDFSISKEILGQLPCSKDVRTAAPLHYLIVANSMFRGQLDQFVNWKKRQGFLVTVAYTDDPEVGTTANSIAAFAKSFYTNATAELPAPTYLLLVGDIAQLPAFSARCTYPDSDHITDLYYVTWTDGDNIPDCYMGRFSANNAGELTPQIEKTLLYEGYNFADDSYLSRGVLIAGEDRGYSSDNAYRYADPAMDYIAKYYINASNGYSDVHYYKNNVAFAPTGVTVDGSCSTTATASALRSLYNTGIGWVNYSAHGYDDSWSTPSFTSSNASQMSNNGKPSIMIGNCCLSGKFNTTYTYACLGEALLRKGNNAGAVAYFGGTNSTYWPQDFCWSVGSRSNIQGTMDASYDAQNLGMYDRLFHTHGEDYSAWRTTAGSMNVAGNAVVNTYSPNFALYYWEIYELFGDPSLMPWLSVASDMTVTADPILPIGSATYVVNAVPYAYVALTTADDHSLVAAAYADATGRVVLGVPSNVTVGDYELAVWAQNHKPYFQPVTVSVLDGPYAALVDIQPAGELRPGEVSYFNATITNIGNQDVAWGQIVITSEDANAAVVRATADFSNLRSGDTLVLSSICPVYVNDALTAADQVRLNIAVDFGADNPSSKRKAFDVVAPRLVVGDFTATSPLVPGGFSCVNVELSNQGSAATEELTFSLESPFGFLQSQPLAVPAGVVEAGDQFSVIFPVTVADDAPRTMIPFSLYVTAGNTTTLLGVYELRCGNSSIDDFETNTFTVFPWSNNDNPWELTTSGAHQGSVCARSKDNLADRSSSDLTVSWTSPVDDSVSFFYKVSSESGYDKFTFSIDGAEMLEASGEEEWQRAAFAVPAGAHTYKFSYTKDYSVSRGSDCAWVDYVTLPYVGDMCTFFFDSICQHADYQFAGAALATDQVGKYVYTDSANNQVTYLELNVIPTPDVTIQTIKVDGCLILKAQGADRYEWSTGETTQAIVVCPSEPTAYTVTGYRAACSAEATTSAVDIRTATAEADVRLYPNPAAGRVTVAAEGMRSVRLVNLMGQVVLSRQQQASSAVLDLQRIPAGIYFVRVETADGVAVKKLVVK